MAPVVEGGSSCRVRPSAPPSCRATPGGPSVDSGRPRPSIASFAEVKWSSFSEGTPLPKFLPQANAEVFGELERRGQRINEPWIVPSLLPRVKGVQPKRRRVANAKAVEVDENHKLDFMYFVEDRLRDAKIPMSIHTIHENLLPDWHVERPWLSSEEVYAVKLQKAVVEESSENLVWIPGPGEDEINRADYVGWDPINSAISLREAAAKPDDGFGSARCHGEVKSFSMRTGWGYITCMQNMPGVGEIIIFYQAALPGILSTCTLGGNNAIRKNTWFKGIKVTFAVDVSTGKPQAKDIKFERSD